MSEAAPQESIAGGVFARTGEPRQILVNPMVSRAKFERELAEYQAIAPAKRRQGWWVLRAEFPEILVAFVAHRVRPAPVVLGALLDFTNYDLWAPSVTIVDPLTETPLPLSQIPQEMRLLRRVPAGPGLEALQPILQAHRPTDTPFLCLPGVREYHEHPAHSGDSWLLHRRSGAGTLYFILEKLYIYGSEPVNGYSLGFQVTGLTRGDAPV